MFNLTRRSMVSGLGVSTLTAPAVVRAQTTSKPVTIGLLSDLKGVYRDMGGEGNKASVELAIQDFGGGVLDRPIEIRQADIQNKADVADRQAREWIEAGVDVLADGASSGAGLAIQAVCAEKKKIFMACGPATSDLTGKACMPSGFQFAYDTWELAHGTGTALTKQGGESWFFITADYAFGYALERDTMAAVRAAGGTVHGAVRAPLGTTDFSPYLVEARASGARVLGFANAGTDLQICLKQAAQFGARRGGWHVATLLMQINDIASLGQDVCDGLVFTDSFYWDLSDKTRAWAKRWSDKMSGMMPGQLHAGMYAATLQWLKAVKEAGSTDTAAVAARMKAIPVNDFYNTNVKIREDGRVMHKAYLWQVKPPAEAKAKFDFCRSLAVIDPKDAWRPLTDGGCPLIKA